MELKIGWKKGISNSPIIEMLFCTFDISTWYGILPFMDGGNEMGFIKNNFINSAKSLKKSYFQWRNWDHLIRVMKKNIDTKNVIKGGKTLKYINKPGIAFSFDDSFRIDHWYEYGKDMFGYYDVKVTFNINAFHHFENQREHTQQEIDMLLELQSNGHDIAHHGFKHRNAAKYSKDYGVEKWIEDDISSLFEWADK
jgi:peptidoglycan/xylan/chitin deacetylase (PgdA/CDA1 family)